MEIKKKPSYKCEYCGKLYLLEKKALEHGFICSKNPKIKEMLCNDDLFREFIGDLIKDKFAGKNITRSKRAKLIIIKSIISFNSFPFIFNPQPKPKLIKPKPIKPKLIKPKPKPKLKPIYICKYCDKTYTRKGNASVHEFLCAEKQEIKNRKLEEMKKERKLKKVKPRVGWTGHIEHKEINK